MQEKSQKKLLLLANKNNNNKTILMDDGITLCALCLFDSCFLSVPPNRLLISISVYLFVLPTSTMTTLPFLLS